MKKLSLLAFVVFSIFAVSSITQAQAAQKKMAVNAGLGIAIPNPIGDLDEAFDYAIPLLGAFQYAVKPNITLEGGFSHYLHTSTDIDFTYTNFGVDGRLWFNKDFDFKTGNAFKDIYLGAGIGITKLEMEYEIPFIFFVPTTIKGSVSDNYFTVTIKGGYVFDFDSFLLDAGIRYDMVDFFEFEILDQPITIYGMASFLF